MKHPSTRRLPRLLWPALAATLAFSAQAQGQATSQARQGNAQQVQSEPGQVQTQPGQVQAQPQQRRSNWCVPPT